MTVPLYAHLFPPFLVLFFLAAENKKNFLSPLNTNEDSQSQLMLPSDQLSPQMQHDFVLPEKNPITAAIEKR